MIRLLGIGTGAVVMVVAASLVTVSFAQAPERPEGPPDRGRPREERGGPGGGGPGGPPSHERFVEHAMKFDTDGDGKLDREELAKFAEDIQRMRGGPGAGRGERGQRGPGPGGPGGLGGLGGPGGAGGPSGSSDGDRPPRPRRPE